MSVQIQYEPNELSGLTGAQNLPLPKSAFGHFLSWKGYIGTQVNSRGLTDGAQKLHGNSKGLIKNDKIHIFFIEKIKPLKISSGLT